MEAELLARRPVGTDWLGKPRVDWYKPSYDWVSQFSLGRFGLGIFLLISIPNHFHGTRTRCIVLFITVFISIPIAAVDWIPYHAHIWTRYPTAVKRWTTPAAAVLGFTLSAAILIQTLQTDDDAFETCQVLASMIFLFSLCQSILATAGLMYFVHYRPLKLPKEYEPVRNGYESDGDSDLDLDSWAQPSQDGQLARIFQAQQQGVQQRQRRAKLKGTALLRTQPPRAESQRTAPTPQEFSATANFGPDTVAWHTRVTLPGSTHLTLTTCLSLFHSIIQLVRYVKAGSCDSLCIFNNIYPPLWIVYLVVFLRLVRKRTNLQIRVRGKVSIQMALSIMNSVIVITWWAALVLTNRGPPLPLFTDKWMLVWYMYHGLILVIISIFAVLRTVEVYKAS